MIGKKSLVFPYVIKLSGDNYEKIKTKLNSKVKFSNIIAQPEFNLGFHYFIHQTKDKMDITTKLDTKEKFYYIVNPYETDKELLEKSRKFFNIKESKPDILSRAFFKIWEIVLIFGLVDDNSLSYSALAEGPGSFLQAILHYREKYYNVKGDKYNSITIQPESGKNIDISKNFLGFYNNKYPQLINMHKTYKSEVAKKYKGKDTGDLTDFKSISNFRKEIKKGKVFSKLVTADGGFAWEDENFQEQEAYPLIIGEILAGIMVQSKGGNMVLKLFETFTSMSIKILYMLCSLYDEMYLYKPYFSRQSNSERYVVCKGFKYDQKKDKKLLDELYVNLEKILKQFDSKQYIIDIFPEMNVPKEFINNIRLYNIQIANKQIEMINLIVSYIKENNYFGDKYHKYLENHNESIKFWIENFLPEKSDLKKTQEKWNSYLKQILKNQKDELEAMNYI